MRARFLMVLLVLLPSTAIGQRGPTRPRRPPVTLPTAPTTPQNPGQAAYQRGIAALNAEQYDQAREALLEALQAEASPNVLFALARAERGAGRFRMAIQHIEQYLQAPPQDAAQVREARQLLAALRADIPIVTISLQPPTAAVFVDGEATTLRDGEVAIDPGHHVIEAQARGFRRARREVDLTVGSHLQVELSLTVSSPVGVLRIQHGLTDATVLVDGREVQSDEFELPSGSHTVEIQAIGRQTFRQTVMVPDGGVATVRAQLQRGTNPRPRPQRTIPVTLWISAGVTGAAALGAIGVGVWGLSDVGAYRQRCVDQAPANDCDMVRARMQDDLNGRATTVNVLWAVAGVGVLGAGGSLLWMFLQRPEPEEELALRVRPGIGTLAFEGRW